MASVQNMATEALPAVSSGCSETFVSSWDVYSVNKDEIQDWFFALGSFSYSVAGVVHDDDTGALLEYKVCVFDRYNWDGGRVSPSTCLVFRSP